MKGSGEAASYDKDRRTAGDKDRRTAGVVRADLGTGERESHNRYGHGSQGDQ